MNVIEELRERSRKYPDAKFEFGSDYVRFAPSADDGFEVELEIGRNEHTVRFNGWHEAFPNAEEAANCFAFGLSRECRLKEYRRSGFAYKWTVEYREEENWIEESTTGLLVFPFWAKPEIRYLQNNLIVEIK